MTTEDGGLYNDAGLPEFTNQSGGASSLMKVFSWITSGLKAVKDMMVAVPPEMWADKAQWPQLATVASTTFLFAALDEYKAGKRAATQEEISTAIDDTLKDLETALNVERHLAAEFRRMFRVELLNVARDVEESKGEIEKLKLGQEELKAGQQKQEAINEKLFRRVSILEQFAHEAGNKITLVEKFLYYGYDNISLFQKRRLHDLLRKESKSRLKAIAGRLGIHADDIDRDTVDQTAMELIEETRRHGCLALLVGEAGILHVDENNDIHTPISDVRKERLHNVRVIATGNGWWKRRPIAIKAAIISPLIAGVFAVVAAILPHYFDKNGKQPGESHRIAEAEVEKGTELETIAGMRVVEDRVIKSERVVIQKDAQITIEPGKTLTLIATDEIAIEHGVSIRAVVKDGSDGYDYRLRHIVINAARGDGGDGEDGERGGDGTDAGSLVIIAKALVVERGLTAVLIGGNGGNGARGVKGADGAPYIEILGEKRGRGGKGGDGGRGGDGGDGGNLSLFLTSSEANRLSVACIASDLHGGKAGKGEDAGGGGDGGDGDISLRGADGIPGEDGIDGKQGKFTVTYRMTFGEALQAYVESRDQAGEPATQLKETITKSSSWRERSLDPGFVHLEERPHQ